MSASSRILRVDHLTPHCGFFPNVFVSCSGLWATLTFFFCHKWTNNQVYLVLAARFFSVENEVDLYFISAQHLIFLTNTKIA